MLLIPSRCMLSITCTSHILLLKEVEDALQENVLLQVSFSQREGEVLGFFSQTLES